MSNPLNTIASIGSVNTPIPVTIIKQTKPLFRDNGAPLRDADRWFDPVEVKEYIYHIGKWLSLSK
jgi:hypothetical protein